MSAQSKTPDRKVIRKMLDDVEAVTKGRFNEDPDPIARPVEMFLIRDGRPGGETFAQLSMREKHQVLDAYTDWQAYAAGGISLKQLDQVFWNAAQSKPHEQWLDGTGLHDQDRKKSLTELKDHGKSGNLASGAARATTDDERKLVLREAVGRLDAAYMAAGADALAKMDGLEIFVLYYDKIGELESVRANLAEHGDNEIGELHKQKLERQTADMAAWMRVHCPDFREIEQEACKTSLAGLKEMAAERTRQTENHKMHSKDERDIER
jgi:hypothetical protein